MTPVTQATEFNLTTSDVGERLGVTDETIRRWADDGRIRHMRLPSGHRRFRQADIDDLLTVVEPAPGGRWDSEGRYMEAEPS